MFFLSPPCKCGDARALGRASECLHLARINLHVYTLFGTNSE